MNTRFAMIIASGAADEPLTELGGRTPLETATIPAIDRLVGEGRVGLVSTAPDGVAPGGDVGLVCLMGYEPAVHFTGRAPIEAVARNVSIGREEVVFRCNLVTVADGVLMDYTAGRIRTAEAEQILKSLNSTLADERVRFVLGRSYRHLAIVRDLETLEAACTPPHDIQGEPVEAYQPHGGGARRLARITERANEIVRSHDVNLVRRDLGETPASAIWLWGQGVLPILPRFRQQHGLRAAIIGGLDLTTGLAKLLGSTPIQPDGATGDVDTNYAAKGRAAIDALAEHELVVVHVEAPAEAAHAGEAVTKIEAMERIDRDIVRPMAEALSQFDNWRMMVAADHIVSTARRSAVAGPTPFVLAGTGIARVVGATAFSEAQARQSDLKVTRGWELMEYFLRL